MSYRRDGYEATTQPRRQRFDGLTHFAIVEREGPGPEEQPTGAINTCKKCGTFGNGLILHQDPDTYEVQRVVCGKCQGDANARRLSR